MLLTPEEEAETRAAQGRIHRWLRDELRRKLAPPAAPAKPPRGCPADRQPPKTELPRR
jgi:hypothetical protein